MNESELLQHIYDRAVSLRGRRDILVGPGDDTAVLSIGNQAVLLTVDQLVARRHYDPAATPIDAIARKAIARSVSDIAAMAGTPTAALATGCLPHNFIHADELFDRMAHWARHFGCPLIGGDVATSDNDPVLTVTVIGSPHPVRGPVLRSTAKPGDAVYVTGRIGNSYNSGRHLAFEPRLREARALADMLRHNLHALIDISDGLGRDAARIAAASDVRIDIDTARIPLHTDAPDPLRALAEGEDYELLFTAPDSLQLPDAINGTPLTRIGSVTAPATDRPTGAYATGNAGNIVNLEHAGWDHQ
ncbi:MAG: thiamine-phosphate kinase [Phycisphaeraceae bacterium]|nr:thiamine-phosphate kinase [Phycisphaerales bacterium]MCB9842992.1 thiamine-phosphate kinase [Phycisphaeraceae bacterium]